MRMGGHFADAKASVMSYEGFAFFWEDDHG